jgi:hypothetical protein
VTVSSGQMTSLREAAASKVPGPRKSLLKWRWYFKKSMVTLEVI